MNCYLAYVKCVKNDADWGKRGQQAILMYKGTSEEAARDYFKRFIPGNWIVAQVVLAENLGIWHLETGAIGQ